MDDNLEFYDGHIVWHSDLNDNLYYIKIINYDEAYNIMIDLKDDGYIVHEIEENEYYQAYTIWFSCK